MEQEQLALSASSRLVSLLLPRGDHFRINFAIFSIVIELALPQCQ